MAKTVQVKKVKPTSKIGQELTVPKSEITPDSKKAFRDEETDLDLRKQEGFKKIKIENDILSAQHEKIKDDNKARRNISRGIFAVVIFWLTAVMFILLGVGLEFIKLSDKVLMTLLSTTSVNVVGLLVIVTGYLFNKSKST